METASPPPVDPSQIPQGLIRWPKIIGIVAITLGVLGILQCASAPISLIFTQSQMEVFLDQGTDPEKVTAFVNELKSLTLSSAVASGIVAILLLVGGIFLLKRKKSAPLLLQIWAVLKILVGGYFTFRSSSLTRLQMDIMTGSAAYGGGREAELVQTFTTYATHAGLIFGIIWIAIFPVFLLIWFSRETVRSEIAKW
ncbi:MAG: hypothetical protein AAF733_02165 [Verrucomicrobiota bacterium]